MVGEIIIIAGSKEEIIKKQLTGYDSIYRLLPDVVRIPNKVYYAICPDCQTHGIGTAPQILSRNSAGKIRQRTVPCLVHNLVFAYSMWYDLQSEIIKCSRKGKKMICDTILEAMGNTPMIRLHHMTGPDDAEILVKFEGLNVGGSIKTRTAYNMIRDAEEKGLINSDTVIVEPTSGNQGIGLALVGAVLGYKVIIIMPDSVSEERRKLVRHYGAEVLLIHDAGNIGRCIEECLEKALEMKAEDPKVFVPQQFENPANPEAQRLDTAREILDQVDGPIHGFCSGIGTGGTITGIGEVLKEQNPDMTIWAVEPENAAILSGGSIGTHVQMGIGDGVIPVILNQQIYDEVCIIKDEEALKTSKELASKEGIMCGISSGTNVAAAVRMAKKLGKGKTVVTVLPDTAERYFSTPLFEE